MGCHVGADCQHRQLQAQRENGEDMTDTESKLLGALTGRPIRVLLVGGYDDMRKEVERNLLTLGMKVISHWAVEDRKGKHRNAPTGTELVIALKDIA